MVNKVSDTSLTRIKGTNEDDSIAGTLLSERIDAKPGNDTAVGGGGDDWIKGGAGNDSLDGGSGSDRVDGNSGDDVLLYNVAENVGSYDTYDGGSGVDTLVLQMSRDDWMRDDVQRDVAAFLTFMDSHTDAKSGMAGGQGFVFESLGLEVRKIEVFKIIVDGVELDPRDDPVVAVDDAATTETEQSTVAGNVTDNDLVPDLVRAVDLVEGPAQGSIQLQTDGSFVYDPGNVFDYLAEGETAAVAFAYRVVDANYDADTATMRITITGTNDVPIAFADAATTDENSVLLYDVLANDTDVDRSDTHTLDVVSVVAGLGTVDIVDNQLQWSPGTNYDYLAAGEQATVKIAYTQSDNHGATATSTASVTVTGVNDAPVAFADTASTLENDPVTIDVLANDTDVDLSDTHSVAAVNIVSGQGTADIVDNAVQWSPGSDYDYLAQGETATVSLQYTNVDNNGATSTAAVDITVTGTNDAPVVQAIDQATTEDDHPVTIDLLGTASDVDASDVLGARNVQQTAGRVVASGLSGSVLTIDPAQFNDLAQGQSETLQFQYTVFDGHVDVANTATLTVQGVNDAPTVGDALTSTASEQDPTYSIDLLAGASDVDNGAVLGVSNLTESSDLGGWTLEGNQLVIDPNHFDALNNGDVATLNFAYQVVDEHGATVDQTLSVDINGFTDAPWLDVQTSAGQQVNQVLLTITTAPANDEHVTLGFDHLPDGSVVLDASNHVVTGGIADATGTSVYTVLLPGNQDTSANLNVTATGVASDGSITGESSSPVYLGFAAGTHSANLTFANQDQSMWASGDAPIVEWHQYLPILGGVARVWNDATQSWEDTNTGMWNSGNITLLQANLTSQDVIDAAMVGPQAILDAAWGVFSTAKGVFDTATNLFNDAVTTANNIFSSASSAALDAFNTAVSATQAVAEGAAYAIYDTAVKAAADVRDATIAVLGWMGQWVTDSANSVYDASVKVASDALNLALSAADWTVDAARTAAQAVYDAAISSANWVKNTAIAGATAIHDAAQHTFDLAQGVYNDAVDAFNQAKADLASAVDAGAEVGVTANLFAQVGAQVDFKLDSGSVDAQVKYGLDASEQYNATSDVLQITPYLTNETTGDEVAFSTLSPNAQFKVVLLYNLGANLDVNVDGHVTVLGTQLLDLSPGTDGIDLNLGLTTGSFAQQLETIRLDGSADQVSQFQGLDAGELTLVDFNSTQLDPITVPFLTGLTKDVLTVTLGFPTIETQGTAAPFDPSHYQEGGLLAVDMGELVQTFMNHVNARLDISQEIKDQLGLPGLDAATTIDDLVNQAAQAVLSQIVNALDGSSSYTPIFIIDATDHTPGQLLLANTIPDSVIGDTVTPDTATFGFYTGYGESNDVVNVDIDVDQLAALIVNEVAHVIADLVTEGATTEILENLPPINPLDLQFGIDEIMKAVNLGAAADDVKKFFDLNVEFQAADFNVNSGLHFTQDFTLSVDDMNYQVTLEDGTVFQFAANDAGSVVIDNASTHDANGDGTVSYTLDVVPSAMFSNDTQIGLTLGYVLDYLKTSVAADLKIPLGDILPIPGLSSVSLPLADINFGPLVRIQGDLDLASADVFESRFKFDLGSAQTTSGVDVVDNVVKGTDGNDVIASNPGNDLLTGGAGNDMFVFGTSSGNDTITDFSAGDGTDNSEHDVLDLTAISSITTFAELIGASHDDGAGNTIIDLGDGNMIKLLGVNLDDLHQNDVLVS